MKTLGILLSLPLNLRDDIPVEKEEDPGTAKTRGCIKLSPSSPSEERGGEDRGGEANKNAPPLPGEITSLMQPWLRRAQLKNTVETLRYIERN